MQPHIDEYLKYEPRQDLAAFATVPTNKWQQLGEQRALQLFHQAAERVPAYKDFLQKNRVDASKIQTIQDFKHLPLTSKNEYINQYPLQDLVMDGDLEKVTVFHYSSGSTGKPTLWPKSTAQDFAAYKGVELLFTYYLDVDKKSTLLINGLAMGAWPSGETIHGSSKILAQKGRPITLISPGANLDQILSIFQDIASNYEQVLISGYPSFLKDIADEGKRRGVDWRQRRIKLLTGGDKPSENWQAYISRAFSLRQPHRDIISVLASSEGGVIGFATPFTDFLRIYLHQHFKERFKLFERRDLPSIVQYIPPAKYVEIIEREIILTSSEYVPLIRYQTKDQGQLLSVDEVVSTLGPDFKNDYDNLQEPYGLPQLPILTIDGRIDRTIIMYGANIYPEQISAILDMPEIQQLVTGRFAVEKTENKQAVPHLKILIELAPTLTQNVQLQRQISQVVQQELMGMNQEFAYIIEHIGATAIPEVELYSYQATQVRSVSGKGSIVKKL